MLSFQDMAVEHNTLMNDGPTSASIAYPFTRDSNNTGV